VNSSGIDDLFFFKQLKGAELNSVLPLRCF
jgi:hypothetical protein